MWLQRPTCKQVIKEAWSHPFSGSRMYKLKSKISNTRRVFKKWKWEVFGCIKTRITMLKKPLKNCNKKIELQRIYNWKQHWHLNLKRLFNKKKPLAAKISGNMLTTMDPNTRCFHLSTIIRWRCSAIEFLRLTEGHYLTNPINIGQAFGDHFQQLIRSSVPNVHMDLSIYSHHRSHKRMTTSYAPSQTT